MLALLDRARTGVLSRAAAIPSLRAWLGPRHRRVATLASAGIVVAFALSILAPAALYALAPIVVGIPHLASDARYLLLRRGSSRRTLVAAALWCMALVAIRVVELATGQATTTARLELAVAAAGMLAALPRTRRALGAAAIVVLATMFALRDPALARIVLAHAHNVVAVVLWILLFPGARRALVAPVVLLAAATTLIVAGATFGPVVTLGSHRALGVELLAVADGLAPSLPDAAVPLTLAYVFLQQIHYAAWLGWIPHGEARAPLTFRQSWRSLVRDLRPTGIVLTLGAMFALAIAAIVSPLGSTRDLYLFVTGIHAYLELAVLARLATLGVR